MGTQLPPKGHSPQFPAHVCCGQTAVSIKMPVDTKVDLGEGQIIIIIIIKGIYRAQDRPGATNALTLC